MSEAKHQITRADILSPEQYAAERDERRAAVREHKRHRRVSVGPFATFYFESYQTMWLQIHEMLYIEKGGEEQIADELAAYNPLIPNGRELVATMMFEIDDPLRRRRVLDRLGHVEETVSLSFAGEEIMAEYETDVERTTPEGKTSSVHFLHFPFTDAQAKAFKQPSTQVVLGIAHENYAHMAVLPEPVRAALAEDLD